MASDRRVQRLNSLLKEVITEVIQSEVRNPEVSKLVSVTSVDISKDLRHAKVYISVIGSEKEKQKTIHALESAASFIAINASKRVTLRYFPELIFKIDRSVEKQMRIDTILEEIHEEQNSRTNEGNSSH